MSNSKSHRGTAMNINASYIHSSNCFLKTSSFNPCFSHDDFFSIRLPGRVFECFWYCSIVWPTEWDTEPHEPQTLPWPQARGKFKVFCQPFIYASLRFSSIFVGIQPSESWPSMARGSPNCFVESENGCSTQLWKTIDGIWWPNLGDSLGSLSTRWESNKFQHDQFPPSGKIFYKPFPIRTSHNIGIPCWFLLG